jgi:hypothetical protein
VVAPPFVISDFPNVPLKHHQDKFLRDFACELLLIIPNIFADYGFKIHMLFFVLLWKSMACGVL